MGERERGTGFWFDLGERERETEHPERECVCEREREWERERQRERTREKSPFLSLKFFSQSKTTILFLYKKPTKRQHHQSIASAESTARIEKPV